MIYTDDAVKSKKIQSGFWEEADSTEIYSTEELKEERNAS